MLLSFPYSRHGATSLEQFLSLQLVGSEALSIQPDLRVDLSHLHSPDRLGQALQTAAWPNHLLVGGLEHCFFHILGMSSSQRTFIFFRGVGIPPTSLDFKDAEAAEGDICIYIYIFVLLLNPRLGESIGHIFFGGGLKQIQVLIGKQRASARAIARNPAWKSAGSLRKYHGYRYRLIGCFVGFEKYLWLCYALDCSDNDGSN